MSHKSYAITALTTITNTTTTKDEIKNSEYLHWTRAPNSNVHKSCAMHLKFPWKWNVQTMATNKFYLLCQQTKTSRIRFGKYLEFIQFVYYPVFKCHALRTLFTLGFEFFWALELVVAWISITRYWFSKSFLWGGCCGANANKSIWSRNRSIWRAHACVHNLFSAAYSISINHNNEIILRKNVFVSTLHSAWCKQGHW